MRLFFFLSALFMAWPAIAQTVVKVTEPAPIDIAITDVQTVMEKTGDGKDRQRVTFTLSGQNTGKKDIQGGYVEVIAYQGGQLFSPSVTFSDGKGGSKAMKNPFPTVFRGKIASKEDPIRKGAAFTSTISETLPAGNDVTDQIYDALWKGQKTGQVTFRVNVAQLNFNDGSIYYGKSIMLGDMKEYWARDAAMQAQIKQIQAQIPQQALQQSQQSVTPTPQPTAPSRQAPETGASPKYPVIDLSPRRN